MKFTFILSALLVPSLVSCSVAEIPTCRSLLLEINGHRIQNGLTTIDEKTFIETIGDDRGCVQTLQKVLEYGSEQSAVTNYCYGKASCTTARINVKKSLAAGLLGNFQNHAQNISYDSRNKLNLFPLFLKNYFARDDGDYDQVQTALHRLNPADLDHQVDFNNFIVQAGESGEIEDVVTVLNISSQFFSSYYAWQNDGKSNMMRLRHLDLVLTSQLIQYEIPADSAVVVSGVRTFSTSKGQPSSIGNDRWFLFLDDFWQRHAGTRHYEWENVMHDLTKAKAAFSAVPKAKVIELDLSPNPTNDTVLRLLIKLLAAAETGHQLYFKMGHVPGERIVELAGFLKKVSRYHPQTVLKALHRFLPQLVQKGTCLDTPESSEAFLQLLAHQSHPQHQSYSGQAQAHVAAASPPQQTPQSYDPRGFSPVQVPAQPQFQGQNSGQPQQPLASPQPQYHHQIAAPPQQQQHPFQYSGSPPLQNPGQQPSFWRQNPQQPQQQPPFPLSAQPPFQYSRSFSQSPPQQPSFQQNSPPFPQHQQPSSPLSTQSPFQHQVQRSFSQSPPQQPSFQQQQPPFIPGYPPPVIRRV